MDQEHADYADPPPPPGRLPPAWALRLLACALALVLLLAANLALVVFSPKIDEFLRD